MNKSIILSFIFLFSCSIIWSQSSKKYWHEGALTWEDFQESSFENRASEFNYFLGYSTDKEIISDTTLRRIVTNSYMDKSNSWVNPSYKNDQYLRYNQVIFDITEIYRRKLQYELDRMKFIGEVNTRGSDIFEKCSDVIADFQNSSREGKNLEAIIEWEKKVDRELKKTPTGIPQFSRGNIGYGLNGGLGTSVFVGSLSEYINPTFNFGYGFDLEYKNSLFYLGGSLGYGKIKKDYEPLKWIQNADLNTAIIEFSYGRTILDNASWKVSPFAGLGLTEVAMQNNDPENSFRAVDVNFLFGVSTDYKIKKSVNLVPNVFFGIKEYVETSIRGRLYVTRAKYFTDFKGYSINFLVSICGFGRKINLE